MRVAQNFSVLIGVVITGKYLWLLYTSDGELWWKKHRIVNRVKWEKNHLTEIYKKTEPSPDREMEEMKISEQKIGYTSIITVVMLKNGT